MGKKVQIRLIQSVKMSEKGENDLVRFPKKAREYFGFGEHSVVVGKGQFEVTLRAKQAWKEDTRRLARMIQQGKVTDEEAYLVGFVTRSTHQRVTRKEGESVWVSPGITDITIGADPEFGLLNDAGLLCRGDALLPGTKHAVFGADGPGVEIRPPPTRDHLQLVRNIQEIFQNSPGGVDSFHWRGGATHKDRRVYWFGGHIHLGRPDFLPKTQAYPVYAKIAQVLDSVLALPMVAFDTPEPWRRRGGCKYAYGKAGDIRADYPEQDRFEYRVLSGLWLTHPTLAKIALGVAKCVAETAYNKICENGCDPDYIEASASQKGLLYDLKVKNQRGIATVINKAQPVNLDETMLQNWERQLVELDYKDVYQEEITALIELTKASPEGVIPQLGLDLKEGWLTDKPFLEKSDSKLKKALTAVEEKA